jgi:hypothetical protein
VKRWITKNKFKELNKEEASELLEVKNLKNLNLCIRKSSKNSEKNSVILKYIASRLINDIKNYSYGCQVLLISKWEFQTQRGDQAKFFDKKFKNGRFSCDPGH